MIVEIYAAAFDDASQMQIVFRHEPTNVIADGEILSHKARGRVVTETETAIHSDLLNCFRAGLKRNTHPQNLNTDRVGGGAALGGLWREAEAEFVYQSRSKDIGHVNQQVL